MRGGEGRRARGGGVTRAAMAAADARVSAGAAHTRGKRRLDAVCGRECRRRMLSRRARHRRRAVVDALAPRAAVSTPASRRQAPPWLRLTYSEPHRRHPPSAPSGSAHVRATTDDGAAAQPSSSTAAATAAELAPRLSRAPPAHGTRRRGGGEGSTGGSEGGWRRARRPCGADAAQSAEARTTIIIGLTSPSPSPSISKLSPSNPTPA